MYKWPINTHMCMHTHTCAHTHTTLYVISHQKKMQIKTTVRYHFILSRLVIVKQPSNKKYQQGGEDIGTSYTAREHVKCCSCLGTVQYFVKRLNIELPYDSENTPKRNKNIYPYRLLNVNVHNSIVHHSQQNVTRQCNGMEF